MLLAAVIDRAMLDLKGTGLHCRKVEIDQAMAFILSDLCEVYCLELEIDHDAIKAQAAVLYRRNIEDEAPETPGHMAFIPMGLSVHG